jgi:hypothetical protein
MSYCAPTITLTKNSFSCFEHYELIEIARAFNRYIVSQKLCSTNDKVCVIKTPIHIEKKTDKELWNSIYSRLYKLCKNEYCWIDLPFISHITDKGLRKKIQNFTFKPKTTIGKYTWLSTKNINSVLQQYEKTHPTFKFIGALPCDFYKIVDVDYNDFKKYENIGIVFNLDKNEEPGSHWVSFFVDNKNNTCEYFDSTGRGPNKCIKKFIDNLMNKYLNKHKYYQNKIVHQTQDSECGVYSIYYIICRVSGKSFDKITKNIIRDEDMNKFRNIFFRPRK